MNSNSVNDIPDGIPHSDEAPCLPKESDAKGRKWEIDPPHKKETPLPRYPNDQTPSEDIPKRDTDSIQRSSYAIQETASRVKTISFTDAVEKITSHTLGFLEMLPLIGNYAQNYLRTRIGKALEEAPKNNEPNLLDKAKLRIFGLRISVLFKKDSAGNFTEIYLKGEKIRAGLHKRVRAVYDLVIGDKMALLASLAMGKVYRGKTVGVGGLMDSFQAIAKEKKNSDVLWGLVGKKECTDGFPLRARQVAWINEKEAIRNGLIAPFCDKDGEDFSRSKASLEERIRSIKELANVIAFLRKHGYCHGDIKPANVVFKRGEGGKSTTHIADLGGMGTRETPPEISTLAYLCPKHTSVMQRDVHALAMTAYELLTGKLMESGPLYVKYYDEEDFDEMGLFQSDSDPGIGEELKLIELFGREQGVKIFNIFQSMITLTRGEPGQLESDLDVQGFLDFLNKEFPNI